MLQIPSRHWTCGFIHVSLFAREIPHWMLKWLRQDENRMIASSLLPSLPPATCYWAVSREYETWILIDLFDSLLQGLYVSWKMFKGREKNELRWNHENVLFFLPSPTRHRTSNNSHVFHRQFCLSFQPRHTRFSSYCRGLKWGWRGLICVQ